MRNGQGTIIEMRSNINKAHFEGVIEAQQSLSNDLREGVSNIENSETLSLGNIKDVTDEKNEPIVTPVGTPSTPDAGKKRTINAGNSSKKQKTKKHPSNPKGNDNKN